MTTKVWYKLPWIGRIIIGKCHECIVGSRTKWKSISFFTTSTVKMLVFRTRYSPIQCIVQPRGSDGRNVPHSCYKLNNVNNVEACTTCRCHNIWFSQLFHWQSHPWCVVNVIGEFDQVQLEHSLQSFLVLEDEGCEELYRDLFQKSVEEALWPLSKKKWWWLYVLTHKSTQFCSSNVLIQ